jgi:hypothetical protein
MSHDSASEMVIVGSEFNPATQSKYSKPKVNNSGGKSVGILNARTNTVLNLSTPLMLTWGISEYVDDKTGKKTYDLSLQFPNEEYATASAKKFLDNVAAFENKIKADAITNSKEWFSKPKMSADMVEALWTPILKYPKNKDTLEPDTTRAPTMRVKIPYYEGQWKFELYDVTNHKIFPDESNPDLSPIDLIAKGSNVAVSIQCGGIWFANGKFGVTWKLFQAIVKPKATLMGKCHIRLGDDDRQRLVSQVVPTDADGGSDDEGVTTIIADSDDEDTGSKQVQAKKEVAKEIVAVTTPAVVAAVEESVAASSDSGPVQKKKIVRKKE